jgi:serine/threonine protein kinase/tetratricopeptide (TPR) repeat protein
MAKSRTSQTALPPEKQQQVNAWLTDFEKTWDEKRLAARAGELPPAGDPTRLPTLIGMIKIDLRRHWQQGHKETLEGYLKKFPELGSRDTVPVSLVQAEYDARLRSGTAPDLTEFAGRFPRQTEELRQHLERIAAAATLQKSAQAGADTSKPHPSPPAGPSPASMPEQFGRYRIVRSLGQGNMGTVYLAHDTQLDRPVALKIPQFSAEFGPEMRERFYREARAAATLEHPNICPVHEVGEINNVHYLVMAFVEGKTLVEVIYGDRPITPRQAAVTLRKLALAMVEAHKKGVVHRDLKPANVMVNKRGEPVIMDFGLAQRVNKGEARLTQQGLMVGTPAYMAPEQVNGEGEGQGPLGDVYSLGVILYELLTRHVPFEGNLTTVLCQIVTQEPAPPSSRSKEIDPHLEAICLKAMAKRVEDRFASMTELAQALTDYLRGEGTPPGPSAPVPHPRTAIERLPASAPPGQKTESALAYASYFKMERPAGPRLGEPAPAAATGSGPRHPRRRKGGQRSRNSHGALLMAACATVALLAAGGIYYLLVLKGRGEPEGGDSKESNGQETVRPREQKKKETLSHIEKGNQALAAKKADEAIAAFSEALRLDPHSALAFTGRAAAYWKKKDSVRALADLNEALRIDPKHAAAYDVRGQVFADQKKYEQAYSDFTEALRHDEKLAEAYLHRGQVHQAGKHFDKALADFSAALKLKKLFLAYFHRGVIHKLRNDSDLALEDFTEALRLEGPDVDQHDDAHADAHNERGLLLLNKDKLDEALEEFNAVIKVRANVAAVFNNRGLIYKKKGVFDKAEENFTRAVQLAPTSPIPQTNRGEINLLKGKFPEAVKDCTGALAKDRQFWLAHQIRGRAYSQTKDWDAALKDFNDAITLGGKTWQGYYYRGVVYQDGKTDSTRAIQDFTEAIARLPRDVKELIHADVYYRRGKAYRAKAEFDHVLRDCTAALGIDPKLLDARGERGIAYYGKNEFPAALSDLDEALKAKSAEAKWYHHFRGSCYARQGDYDKGLEDFKKALDLGLKTSWNYLGLGYCQHGKKKYMQAISDYTEALKLDPKFAMAYYFRALALRARRNAAAAQLDYVRAKSFDGKIEEHAWKFVK